MFRRLWSLPRAITVAADMTAKEHLVKHLIVVAHPVENSFTLALAHTYAQELEKLGHVQQTRDLYRMGFDPLLSGAEILSGASGDAAQAQEDIRQADVLTVIYPLWWLSMPAMMKGYIDRVLARGFAYESEKGNVRGLLTGKMAVLITISGAPLPLLVASGNWNAVQVLQDTHIFRAAGFTLLEHLHLDTVSQKMAKTTADQYLARARACAQEHFPATLH